MFPAILLQSFLLGFQHSFEPDHLAAVSVLATEADQRKISFRQKIWLSSQWALGHSFTLIVFASLILLLKSTLSLNIASYVELLIGPLMIWLGLSAMARNFKAARVHSGSPSCLPAPSRSFWVGMVHGMAGTGGACAIALTLAAHDVYMALGIIVLQSAGIILAMTTYSCLFAFSATKFIRSGPFLYKAVNYIVGVFSIIMGIYILVNH